MRIGDGETDRPNGRVFVGDLIVDVRNGGGLILSGIAANFDALIERAIAGNAV